MLVKSQRLHEIAQAYHAECEAYDLVTCSCRDEVTGVAIPLTRRERQLVNVHALQVLNRLVRENKDLTKQEIVVAIGRYPS